MAKVNSVTWIAWNPWNDGAGAGLFHVQGFVFRLFFVCWYDTMLKSYALPFVGVELRREKFQLSSLSLNLK